MTRILLASAVFLLTIPAWADVIYSAGAINGNIYADSFYTPAGWTLSQPFTVGSDSVVTDLSDVGIWIFGGYSFQSLTWTISTGADGSGAIATDTVSSPASSTQLTPASDYGYSGQADVYSMSFSVPDVLLTSGTYYLTLSNGATNCNCSSADESLYWDRNDVDNTGVAYFSGNPDFADVGWAFQVDGYSAGTSPVPEPSDLILVGAGILAIMVQKKIRPKSNAPQL